MPEETSSSTTEGGFWNFARSPSAQDLRILRRAIGVIRPSPVARKEVLLLRRGMLLRSTVAKLRPPDVVEEGYEANASPERILRYGSWELRFHDGKLTMPTPR